MTTVKILSVATLVAAATVSFAGCSSGSVHSSSIPSSAAAAASVIASAASSAAAASGATASGSGVPGTAACPLTATQVTNAMGETYGAPTSSYGICTYASSDNALTIQVHDASGDFDFAATLATAEQDNGSQTTTTIPGLGDKASGVGLEIIVQSGAKTIDIRNADSPGFGKWPKSIALAKLIIAGLH